MNIHEQEVQELTELMRTEWSDLSECINAAGHNAKTTLLVAFAEDETENEYCIFVTSDGRIFDCARSTISGASLVFSSIEELPQSEETFKLTPTIKIALEQQNAA